MNYFFYGCAVLFTIELINATSKGTQFKTVLMILSVIAIFMALGKFAEWMP